MPEVIVGPAIALLAVAGAVWDFGRWGGGKWAVHPGPGYLHASGLFIQVQDEQPRPGPSLSPAVPTRPACAIIANIRSPCRGVRSGSHVPSWETGAGVVGEDAEEPEEEGQRLSPERRLPSVCASCILTSGARREGRRATQGPSELPHGPCELQPQRTPHTLCLPPERLVGGADPGGAHRGSQTASVSLARETSRMTGESSTELCQRALKEKEAKIWGAKAECYEVASSVCSISSPLCLSSATPTATAVRVSKQQHYISALGCYPESEGHEPPQHGATEASVLSILQLRPALLNSMLEVHNKVDLVPMYSLPGPCILAMSALDKLKAMLEESILQATGWWVLTLCLRLGGPQLCTASQPAPPSAHHHGPCTTLTSAHFPACTTVVSLQLAYKEARMQQVQELLKTDTTHVTVIISQATYGQFRKLFCE
ncbi:Putative GTP-binding protein 6 [Lemmus lemmus]